MDLMALDSNLVPVGKTKIKYLDLMWNRKYYEVGQFSVQIKKEDYSSEMSYVFTKERPELGIIQKVKYEEESGTVELSGFFFERKLKDKIIYPTFERDGTRSEFVAAAVEAFKQDIPKLVVAAYANDGEIVQKQETGATLEEMSHSTLQVEEKSYRCVYDFEEDVIRFEIYEGKDRTQGQTANNFVTFSKGFRNIKSVAVNSDSSAYKNYFIVGGAGEGAERITVIHDLSGGGYRQELFIDGSKKTYNEAKQTLKEYKEILMQMAVEKAVKYVDIQNVEFDAVADAGAKYLKDYDLGDKCDVIIEQIGKSYEARIIEILETWNSGKHQVTLTFGDKIPTQYEKARIN